MSIETDSFAPAKPKKLLMIASDIPSGYTVPRSQATSFLDQLQEIRDSEIIAFEPHEILLYLLQSPVKNELFAELDLTLDDFVLLKDYTHLSTDDFLQLTKLFKQMDIETAQKRAEALRKGEPVDALQEEVEVGDPDDEPVEDDG